MDEKIDGDDSLGQLGCREVRPVPITATADQIQLESKEEIWAILPMSKSSVGVSAMWKDTTCTWSYYCGQS